MRYMVRIPRSFRGVTQALLGESESLKCITRGARDFRGFHRRYVGVFEGSQVRYMEFWKLHRILGGF